MKVFLLALAVLALAVAGMSFNILFRKDGKFPEYEVGSNEEMKKRGITCEGKRSEACKDCKLNTKEQEQCHW